MFNFQVKFEVPKFRIIYSSLYAVLTSERKRKVHRYGILSKTKIYGFFLKYLVPVRDRYGEHSVNGRLGKDMPKKSFIQLPTLQSPKVYG